MDLVEGTVWYKPGPNQLRPSFVGTDILDTV